MPTSLVYQCFRAKQGCQWEAVLPANHGMTDLIEAMEKHYNEVHREAEEDGEQCSTLQNPVRKRR